MRGLREAAIVLAAILWSLASSEAATVPVDCGAGGSIQKGLTGLKPGDTLLVSGSCGENALIPAELTGVTLDGQGNARITPPDPSRDAVHIEGRAITIKGFAIDGGRNGVVVTRGAAAVIDGNVIQNAGKSVQVRGAGDGVVVSQSSSAVIINNTIRDNGRYGIFVFEGSSARIGFVDVAASEFQKNTIQNNGGNAIQVMRSSTARITGNNITGNKGDGVRVSQNANAGLANNIISGNTGDAVNVTQLSGVNLVFGPGPFGVPSKTDATMRNGGFGIKCSGGGYVDGPLGGLAGTNGAKDVDTTCIDRVTAAR